MANQTQTVELYGRFEAQFEAACDYENALQDVRVRVVFECASERQSVDAFWDGGLTWLVRFSPETAGTWSWKTTCSRRDDAGLHGVGGSFECSTVAGASMPRGPLRVAASKTHLQRADGTPFLWIGDTVWNGPLKASEADWEGFLNDRASKGFNAIQFVATQWISAVGDAEGRPAYLGLERIRIEPAFFHRLDQRIDAINAHGMVAAPVLAWAAGWNPDSAHFNAGNSLNDEQLILLVRYLISRYGAHDAVWILAGDGLYTGEEAERWRRVGRAALADSTRLATMHPGGKLWVAAEFRDESWFAFNSYQSGHWNDDDNFRWINEGPPSQDWQTAPVCPHINQEPCYEGHRPMAPGAAPGLLMDDHDIRRACYWSLLTAPAAGVTYGAHGVWSWESRPEFPLSHPNTGIARPWREAMEFPGARSIAHLAAIFHEIEWWRLRPAPRLLVAQPGFETPALFVGAAASDERDLAVVYLPEGGSVELCAAELRAGLTAECIDPATGAQLWSRPLTDCGSTIDTGGPRDRVLVIRSNEVRH